MSGWCTLLQQRMKRTRAHEQVRARQLQERLAAVSFDAPEAPAPEAPASEAPPAPEAFTPEAPTSVEVPSIRDGLSEYQCPHCERTFKTTSGLSSHIAAKHVGEE
jgi:hypothetical protein